MKTPTKVCSKCKEMKPLDQYWKNKKNKDGYRCSCKSCMKEYAVVNKDRIAKRQKKHYQKNKEKYAEYQKQYTEQNREKINARESQYTKYRRSNDPVYRCRVNIRGLISQSFSNQNTSKKSKTFKILGCSPEWFYNEWLEKKYNPPHTHLDHIIPISLAQNEKEVILLNHYSNFQVLDAEQNMEKGNRYISLQGLNKVLENHPNFKDVKSIIKREGIEVR